MHLHDELINQKKKRSTFSNHKNHKNEMEWGNNGLALVLSLERHSRERMNLAKRNSRYAPIVMTYIGNKR